MSVPLFPAGRDLLEFSRDREDDVLLFTDTRIWPTNNISERGARPTKTYPDATWPARWTTCRPAWPPGGPMPTTTSWNNRCDLLTGSSTVKATHPRGNLRRDNGPLSRPPVVAIRTAQLSRTWPGVRRWTGGGIRAHPESVSERVMIPCRDSGRVTGCGTD